MQSTDSAHYQAKLKRLGHHLSLSESVLQTHPLISDKLLILQTVLHYFTLQAEWSAAGPLSRLSMTFQTALRAHNINASQSGFIGPALNRMQLALVRLMQALLSPSERKHADLLVSFTEVLTVGVAYLATQTLGNWKRLFPPVDSGAAKNAGLLLRELGLTYVLGSRLLETPFLSLGKQLDLSEKKQKRLSYIGLSYLMIILLLVNEEDQPNHEDLFELIQRFISPTLGTVEEVIQEALDRSIIEEGQAVLALGQLQLLRRAIDSSDPAALKQALLSSFEALELPYEEVRKDIKTVIELSKQLNESFKNIFYQTELTVTGMTQSA